MGKRHSDGDISVSSRSPGNEVSRDKINELCVVSELLCKDPTRASCVPMSYLVIMITFAVPGSEPASFSFQIATNHFSQDKCQLLWT